MGDAAAEANGIANLDLTVDLITYRFTPGSKSVLNGWYPGFSLEMDEARQVRRTAKFNSVKYVYTAGILQEMCTFFEGVAKDFLPPARILYWT